MKGTRLGIAGVGLIGGSIALCARTAGAVVIGYDIDRDAVARARARGALDDTAPDLASLAAQCETLVVAAPVDATLATLDSLAALANDARRPLPTLVMDVASVKAPFVACAAALHTFIGTHPMAGKEVGGIDAADPQLFAGATWAYAPHANAKLSARAREFITAMGAVPLALEPDVHDAIVALTSHLPQALSVTLGSQLAEVAGADPRVLQLCGTGMHSMLRLARSPESVWAPIAAANARPLAEAMRACAARLLAAADRLDAADISVLMSYFGDASRTACALEERFSDAQRSSPYHPITR